METGYSQQYSVQDEMALRVIKAVLKYKLKSYNTASMGLVNSIIDEVIPLPPSPMDALIDGSAPNPLAMIPNSAGSSLSSMTGAMSSMVGIPTTTTTEAPGFWASLGRK